jgi:hypothetical protein
VCCIFALFAAINSILQRKMMNMPSTRRSINLIRRQQQQQHRHYYTRNGEINPYRVLGISSTASKQEIKKHYYKLCQKYHPDINPSPEAKVRMAEINGAYDSIQQQQQQQQNLPQQSQQYQQQQQYHQYYSSDYIDEMAERLKRQQQQHYKYTETAEAENLSTTPFRTWLNTFRFVKRYRQQQQYTDYDQKFIRKVHRLTRTNRLFSLFILILAFSVVLKIVSELFIYCVKRWYSSSHKRRHERV